MAHTSFTCHWLCVKLEITNKLFAINSREQIFAGRNHHLLAKDYSENHANLSISYSSVVLPSIQTIFIFNIGHSQFFNSMFFWEIGLCYEVAREQDSLRSYSKPKNVITLEKLHDFYWITRAKNSISGKFIGSVSRITMEKLKKIFNLKTLSCWRHLRTCN